MANPKSKEIRKAIIKHMQAGESKEDIAKWLFVSKRTITRIWSKFLSTGSYDAEPRNSGRKPLVTEETMAQVVASIKKDPDKTLLELIEEFSLGISQSALCRRLIKLGLTYKKKRCIQMGRSAKMS